MTEPYFTPMPQSVGIEITNRCNLACQHCFNRSGEGAVSELTLAELVSVFDQCQAMGLSNLRVSGGEPTLHRDFPAVIAAAVERGLEVSLNTNGCFTSAQRRRIAGLPLACFLVSLDGLQAANDAIRGEGVFAQVLDTVHWLRSQGSAVTLATHLSSLNAADVPGLIALAADLGADVKFSPLRPIGRARDGMKGNILSPETLYQAVKTITHLRTVYPKIRILTDFDILRPITAAGPLSPTRACCAAGRSMVNINYDGYVYPCAFLVTPEREFAAGHISQAPLLTLWQGSSVFGPFRTLERDARCQACFAYGQTCVGGCPAMSYFAAGRLEAHDPTCFIEFVSSSDLR